MGLYDEVSVTPGNKVKIRPPKTLYQSNTFDCTMSYLSIDKEGVITYDSDPKRVINTIHMDLYGEDEAEYCRKYVLVIRNNQIELVHEVEDDGSHTECYLSPVIRAAAQRMANNMLPLHRRIDPRYLK